MVNSTYAKLKMFTANHKNQEKNSYNINPNTRKTQINKANTYDYCATGLLDCR